MSAEACPLSGAQIALCRLVHRGPRPQVTLKPLQTELELYVEKTRAKQKQRYECLGGEVQMNCPALGTFLFYR